MRSLKNSEELQIGCGVLSDPEAVTSALRDFVHPDPRSILNDLLLGRVWHMTHPFRFFGIWELKEIRPDMPYPQEYLRDAELPNCALSRELGANSLFDLRETKDDDIFGENAIHKNFVNCFPYSLTWGASVWIELDPSICEDSNYLSTTQTTLKGFLRNVLGVGNRITRYFGFLESAFVGPISSDYFRSVVFLSCTHQTPQVFPWHDFDEAGFVAIVTDWGKLYQNFIEFFPPSSDVYCNLMFHYDQPMVARSVSSLRSHLMRPLCL